MKYLVLGELSTTARDTILVDEALRWLAAPAPQPFFLYVHMMSPHHPYDPPPPFDRFVPDRTHAPVKNYPRKSYRFFEGGEPLDGAALADMIAPLRRRRALRGHRARRACLAGLDALGLASTTAVLVTADHGEEFFEHGNWGHGQSVYNELIRVPLVLRLPDGGGAGRPRDDARVARRRRADAARDRRRAAGARARRAKPPRRRARSGDAVSELLLSLRRVARARARHAEARRHARGRAAAGRACSTSTSRSRRATDLRPAGRTRLATALDERVQAEMRARSAPPRRPSTKRRAAASARSATRLTEERDLRSRPSARAARGRASELGSGSRRGFAATGEGQSPRRLGQSRAATYTSRSPFQLSSHAT